MKKTVIAAAIVTAVGFSAYLGFRPDPTSTLTELQLANAEALSNGELPPIEVLCPAPSIRGGNCHEVDPMGIEKDCGGMTFTSCKFNGIRESICSFC